MKTRSRKPRQAGLTLLEVVISMAILIIVIGIAFVLLFKSTETYENQSVHLSMDTQLREHVKQISEELRMGRDVFMGTTVGALIPLANAVTTASYIDLQFRYPGNVDPADPSYIGFTGLSGGTDKYFNRRVRYSLMPAFGENVADGVDNNGDGRINEQVIRRTEEFLSSTGAVQSTSTNTFNKDVKFGQFFIRKMTDNPVTLEITLTLQKTDPKTRKLMERSMTTQVQLRN
jgi:type II secretory pathway pseudopilin PulG